jgi:hypothetical protein
MFVISRCEGGRVAVFADEDAGVLPVFCFEEEAGLFLRFEAPEGEGWRVKRSTAGELISLLYSLCAAVDYVALDPLPSDFDLALRPALLDREEFLEALAGVRAVFPRSAAGSALAG